MSARSSPADLQGRFEQAAATIRAAVQTVDAVHQAWNQTPGGTTLWTNGSHDIYTEPDYSSGGFAPDYNSGFSFIPSPAPHIVCQCDSCQQKRLIEIRRLVEERDAIEPSNLLGENQRKIKL